MLEVTDLHTYYGESHVIQGVSLTVRPGECVALMGRNGAGKTTILRSILRLTKPRRGHVTFMGRTLDGLHTHEITRRGIGYVPDYRGIFPSLDVDEHLQIVPRPRGESTRERQDRVNAVYETFPRLAERRAMRGDRLSGGEKQMLAIGRALLAQPELLIMDEPSEGLAPVIIDSLEQTIRRVVASGTACLLVEQNYRLATALANRAYVLNQGRIVFDGSCAALDSDSEVQHKFLAV